MFLAGCGIKEKVLITQEVEQVKVIQYGVSNHPESYFIEDKDVIKLLIEEVNKKCISNYYLSKRSDFDLPKGKGNSIEFRSKEVKELFLIEGYIVSGENVYKVDTSSIINTLSIQ